MKSGTVWADVVGGSPWRILGAIRAVTTVWEAAKIILSCELSPLDKFYDIEHNVNMCRHVNFRNKILKNLV